MTKLHKALIKEKKELLKDFYIKWDPAIEERFEAKVAANPDKDPQCILDSIVRPYIDKQLEWNAFDNYPTRRKYKKRKECQ